MESDKTIVKMQRPKRKLMLWGLGFMLAILSVTAIFVSRNFNQFLTDALLKSFNSNPISDVYELKFEKLRVDIFRGNIKVINVMIQPRSQPLHSYPYINSSFRLSAGKIFLQRVQLSTLFRTNKLKLLKIEIVKPDVQVLLAGDRNVMLPFQDSTLTSESKIKDLKKFITSYFLGEFKLIDASFHITNKGKQREFKVDKLNILLSDLMINQQSGRDLLSFKEVNLRIGEISGKLKLEALKNVFLKDYALNIESLNIQKTLDTLIFHFADFSTSMKALKMLTADSIFQISAQSIDVSYLKKSVRLTDLSFKPNISKAALQRRYDFQVPQFSGVIAEADFKNINFDTLIYRYKIIVEEIDLDSIEASVFKDKTKPLDKNYIPEYLGQMLKAIPLPLLIKQLKATHLNIVNIERKPDGGDASIKIQRGTLEAKNITNLSSQEKLLLKASGFIENRAFFILDINFSYIISQFSFSGNVGKFNLPDLNQFFQSYYPVSINNGIVDGITFSGNATKSKATGEMKFLYHDLKIDLKLTEKKKFQNSIINFAANKLLSNANPATPDNPPRIVQFTTDRDMNKGFINIILKSFFSGMQQTMFMSKENRKTFQENKKDWKFRRK